MKLFQAAQKKYETDRSNPDNTRQRRFKLGKVFECSYQSWIEYLKEMLERRMVIRIHDFWLSVFMTSRVLLQQSISANKPRETSVDLGVIYSIEYIGRSGFWKITPNVDLFKATKHRRSWSNFMGRSISHVWSIVIPWATLIRSKPPFPLISTIQLHYLWRQWPHWVYPYCQIHGIGAENPRLQYRCCAEIEFDIACQKPVIVVSDIVTFHWRAAPSERGLKRARQYCSAFPESFS